MVAIKIYNNNRNMVLPTRSTISLNSVSDVFDDNLEGGTYSIPIDVDATPELRVFLGWIENLAMPQVEHIYAAEIYKDGKCIMQDAYIELESHSGFWDMRATNYKFNITSTRAIIGKQLANKKLTSFNYGGLITWASGNSRDFANELMHGTGQYQFAERIAFAPVKNYDYIDDTRDDFNGEVLQHDVLNQIIENSSYLNGWQFGAHENGNNTIVAGVALTEHSEHRTVPFLNLVWVIKSIFREIGYDVVSELFNDVDFSCLYLWNNMSLEKYNWPAFADANKTINPSLHAPDILAVEFLIELKKVFNLKFTYTKEIIYISKKTDLLLSQTQDISKHALAKYNNAKRTEINKNGVSLTWDFVGIDSYAGDVVKELESKNIITTFATYADIASYTFGVLTDNDYVLVLAENYYYKWDALNAKWNPDFEAHQKYTLGKGSTTYDLKLAPMCTAYQLDAFNNNTWLDMVGVRATGSYQSNNQYAIKNEFDLRMFFIKKLDVGTTIGKPTSYTHNINKNGVVRGNLSLSLYADNGIIKTYWEKWLHIMQRGADLQIMALLDEFNTLPDIVMLNNQRYLVAQYDINVDEGTATMDVVTITPE